jgi:hypothetical protein
MKLIRYYTTLSVQIETAGILTIFTLELMWRIMLNDSRNLTVLMDTNTLQTTRSLIYGVERNAEYVNVMPHASIEN